VNLLPDEPPHYRFAFVNMRRWVIVGAAIGAVAYAVLSVATIGARGWQLVDRGPLVGAFLLCVLGGVLARRGRVFLGGVIALSGAWIEIHTNLLVDTEFPSQSLVATPAILVAATMLLRPRQSVVFALGTIGLTWLAVLRSPALATSGVTTTVGLWLLSHATVSLAVWALVTLVFTIVDQTFSEMMRTKSALAETINKAPDGILVIDAAGIVEVANPAAEVLLGVRGAECVGRPIAEVVRQPSQRGAAEVAPVIANTDERPRVLTLLRDDATSVELEVTLRAMDGGRRQLVLRDISERLSAERTRRDMELQLAHSQRLEAVGQLAGGIAHDFNNILTIVGASAEVMRSELADDRHAPLLDEILAAQERGATLTRQLLAFARREVVQPQVFDLSAHVLTLRRLLQRVAGEQTRISCDVEPDCRIRADVGQVEQALVNLVGNARDAMPDGGTCSISVVRMNNDDGELWVRLRVSDTGRGMDAATQARAFEPFFTTKPRGRGTGLGLAAVHGMVMQSGGRADIETVPDLGTCVVLEFLFAAGPVAVPVTDTPSVRTADGACILVAEDDDGTRATVARMLARLGHAVLLAPDGMQALRLAEQHAGEIDLLLTDVMMPGMSGPQLVARLRQRGISVPAIYMSGYPEDALEEADGLRLETDFLAKPFTSAQLARRVCDKLGLSLTSPRPG
jgi:two-component system cell cycle sensor histidine kinase/response regulator CckA